MYIITDPYLSLRITIGASIRHMLTAIGGAGSNNNYHLPPQIKPSDIVLDRGDNLVD